MLFVGFAIAAFGILGLTIKDTANEQIKQTREEINQQVTDQFKTENIKSVVQQVASVNASELIRTIVEPSIASSQKTLDSFNQHLDDQKKLADSELATFRNELSKLEKRNEITELADQAIEKGDVEAFRKLRALASQSNSPEGANGELLRIMGVFSPLGFTRFNGVTLNASAVHPGKLKESDLDATDLLLVISTSGVDDPSRARAAVLLSTVGKVGSYSTAAALVYAIEHDSNLWVIKDLKSAFYHIVNGKFSDDGSMNSVDGTNIVNWWKDHEDEVAKADTDPKQ